MARKTLRRLIEKPLGTEWERLVRKIRRRQAIRFLVFWNRGLGDIALGLCRLIDELRRIEPNAEITIVTRGDLADAFALLPVDRVLVDPKMARRGEIDAAVSCKRLDIQEADFDLVLARPDPTHWFRKPADRAPRLHWPTSLDGLSARFDAAFDDAPDATPGGRIDIGVHVHSETGVFYNYRKDWPAASWQSCFERLQALAPVRFVLLGHSAEHRFEGIDCIDLRGRTSFLEMMSVIRNRCRLLIAPDSGVLTMTYYLDAATPIDVVSLWADPRQGILKQGMPSPNPLLRHRALLAPGEAIEQLEVDTVVTAVRRFLATSAGEEAAPALSRQALAAGSAR